MNTKNQIVWSKCNTVAQISKNQIHIWRSSLLIGQQQFAAAIKILNTKEQRRAKRFQFAKHRRRFTAARATLRILLGKYLNCPPQQVEFSYSHHGKPFIANNTLNFNISHSGELALFAFGNDLELGIDLEQQKQRELTGIAERFFAPSEFTALQKLPTTQQAAAFYHIWTQKESFIKAIGEGLSFPLDKFCVTATTPAKLLSLEGGIASDWTLQTIGIEDPYYAAIAYKGKVETINYWLYDS